MDGLMLPETGRMGESLLAQLALIRSFASVGPSMGVQSRGLDESLVAYFAPISTLARVNPLVHYQRSLLGECLRTVVTLIRLLSGMRSFVSHQRVTIGESLSTVLTGQLLLVFFVLHDVQFVRRVFDAICGRIFRRGRGMVLLLVDVQRSSMGINFVALVTRILMSPFAILSTSVVSGLVSSETADRRKLLLTSWTGVRLIAGMLTFVDLHIALKGEAFRKGPTCRR